MWTDEHVVKKTLCVLPVNSFLLKKGNSEEICVISSHSCRSVGQNAQALLGKVHLITGHGGPDRE